MPKPNPPAKTIFTWLRNNKIPLGALTHHDGRALRAAVQIAEAWICGDRENRQRSAIAFREMVLQMQPTTRYMAYHSIAHVADWSHRSELWHSSGLAEICPDDVRCKPDCAFAPHSHPCPSV